MGVGLVQACRGIFNTPEALREQSKGRFWDQVGSTYQLLGLEQHHMWACCSIYSALLQDTILHCFLQGMCWQ